MALLKRLLRALPLLLLSPLLMAVGFLALVLTNLFTRRGIAASAALRPAANQAATVVIPNWNGRDLLERYIPIDRGGAGGQSGERDSGGG